MWHLTVNKYKLMHMIFKLAISATANNFLQHKTSPSAHFVAGFNSHHLVKWMNKTHYNWVYYYQHNHVVLDVIRQLTGVEHELWFSSRVGINDDDMSMNDSDFSDVTCAKNSSKKL